MDNRLPIIFLHVCQKKRELTVSQLAQQLAVSARTIYSDIKRLNLLLKESGYLQISTEKGKLLYLTPLMVEFERLLDVDSTFVISNPRLRRLRMIETILTTGDQFTVDDLLKEFDLSRNTLISALKEIREILGAHSIVMEATPFKGYRICGSERNIRNFLILSISEEPLFFEEVIGKKQPLILSRCETFLEQITGQLNVELSDISFTRVLIAFYVTYARVSIGKTIREEPREILSKEDEIFAQCQEQITDIFGQKVPLDECLYLARKLAEASVVKYDERLSEHWLPFHLVTNHFIDAVGKEYPCEAFYMDPKLYEGLLNHLRPAYKRAVAGLWIENPLFDYVMDSFPELNQAVTRAVKVLEDELKVKFNEHEVSYFTLFFASVIERNKKQIRRKPNVMIVCHAGISTSEVLRSRLQANFNVNIVGTFSVRNAALWLAQHVPDLIVSTVPLQWQGTPVLKVNPYLSADDLTQIQSQLSFLTTQILLSDVLSIIGRHAVIADSQLTPLKNELSLYLGITEYMEPKKGIYQPMLMEILTTNLINAKFAAKTRDEAVRESGRLLVNQGLADESYTEAMIKNVEVNGTYIVISPGIAMPHARPEEGALHVGLSIVTLKEPVVFGHPKNDPVNIVVGLCAIDHQSHLKALTELADILMDKKKVAAIHQADTAEEILQIVKGE